MKHLSSLWGLGKYFYMLFFLLTIQSFSYGQSWDIYTADALPDASDPAFSGSNNSNSANIVWAIEDDPDVSGNKLLGMNSLTAGEAGMYKTSDFEPIPTAYTVVVRIKLKDGSAERLTDIDMHINGFRDQLNIRSNGQLTLQRSGGSVDLSGSFDPAQWNIIRMTVDASSGTSGDVNIYLNEDPTPVLTSNTTTTTTSNYFRFGDGNGSPTYSSYIDFVAYDAGAYSPSDQALPEGLIPAETRSVAYIYKSISKDPSAANQDGDAIFAMLNADAHFNVTPIASTGGDIVDLEGYDLVIVQESFGSGDAILKRDGSLGLKNIAVPFIYNKTYALRGTKAIDETIAIATVEETTDLSVNVLPADQTHEIFSGLDFTEDNLISIYKNTASDVGGSGTKSLNPLSRLKMSTTGTLLATAGSITDYDSSILINDIPAGTQFGDNALDVTQARMIALAFNYGASINDRGRNITAEGLTIWRNAVYSLAGFEVPSTPIMLPSTLDEITVNEQAIVTFNSETTTYDIELPFGTTTVPTVAALTSDSLAIAVIKDAASLPGATTIEVTSRDDLSSTTYTLNFTVASDPIKKIAYVQKTGFSAATTSASPTDDPIIQMLEADENFEVTVFETTDGSEIDFTPYHIIIAQETFGSGDAIWSPTGALGIKNIPKPIIYNKSWALRGGKAITSSTATMKITPELSVTVDPSNQSNDLFSGLSFTDNKITLFKETANNDGSTGTNSLDCLIGLEISNAGTLLAQTDNLSGEDLDKAILINDLPIGTQLGTDAGDVLNNRMIAFAFNYGAMIRNKGTNMTSAALTIWRNAAYSLAGLDVPNTAVEVPSDVSSLSNLTVDGTSIDGFDAATLTYDVELPAGSSAVPTVVGTATDASATVTNSDASAIPGTTTVTVKAENNFDSTVYTLNFTIYEVSQNALLADLTIDGTTVDGFSDAIISYSVELAEGTTTVPTVVGTAADDSASVVVTPAASLPGSTTVVVTAEDGSTTKTYTISFTVSGGSSELSNADLAAKFNTYPNPVINIVTIESIQTIKRADLFNLNGQLIQSQDVKNLNKVNVDLSNVPEGIYLLKTTHTNNKVIDRKIIK